MVLELLLLLLLGGAELLTLHVDTGRVELVLLLCIEVHVLSGVRWQSGRWIVGVGLA